MTSLFNGPSQVMSSQRRRIFSMASYLVLCIVVLNLIVLNRLLRQSSLVSTNVTSSLEVFFNDMRYINSRYIYLLTYLLAVLLLNP